MTIETARIVILLLGGLSILLMVWSVLCLWACSKKLNNKEHEILRLRRALLNARDHAESIRKALKDASVSTTIAREISAAIHDHVNDVIN